MEGDTPSASVFAGAEAQRKLERGEVDESAGGGSSKRARVEAVVEVAPTGVEDAPPDLTTELGRRMEVLLCALVSVAQSGYLAEANAARSMCRAAWCDSRLIEATINAQFGSSMRTRLQIAAADIPEDELEVESAVARVRSLCRLGAISGMNLRAVGGSSPQGRLGCTALAEAFAAGSFHVVEELESWGATPTALEGILCGELVDETGGIHALTVLRDGRIATGNWLGGVLLWHAATGKCEELRRSISIHRNVDSAVRSFAVLRGERELLAASVGDRVLVWDVQTRELLHRLAVEDGRRKLFTLQHDYAFGARSHNGSLVVWNGLTGAYLSTLRLAEDADVSIILRDWRIATGGADVCIWNEAGDREATLTFPKTMVKWGRGVERESRVGELVELCDGRLAGVCGFDVRVWDIASGESALIWANNVSLLCMAALHDGRLACSGHSGIVHVLNADLPALELEMTHLEEPVEFGVAVGNLTVLRDGRLASAANNGVVMLWA